MDRMRISHNDIVFTNHRQGWIETRFHIGAHVLEPAKMKRVGRDRGAAAQDNAPAALGNAAQAPAKGNGKKGKQKGKGKK
eukprot:gene105-biopygen331